jgi:DNA-binding transcriptional MerR regulator
MLYVANIYCNINPVTAPRPSLSLPAKALREFEKAAKSDWQGGTPLIELLRRVNRVAVRFLPEEDGQHSRVKRQFTERSFRHYQTLGCIDPPEKEGHRASYHYRHLVQALLVRKLLWERVPSEQIAALMAGRSTDETERMFLGGVEMVARAEGSSGGAGSAAPGPAEMWRRVGVSPGVELHIRSDLPKPKPAELKKLVGRLETALRRNL